MTPSMKAKIDQLEATRPDPVRDPIGHRQVNDKITQLIDEDRAASVVRQRKVV